jgi:hypothetical protein
MTSTCASRASPYIAASSHFRWPARVRSTFFLQKTHDFSPRQTSSIMNGWLSFVRKIGFPRSSCFCTRWIHRLSMRLNAHRIDGFLVCLLPFA